MERSPEEILQYQKSRKMLLYIGIFSIIMMFGGLTSAYIVSMSDGFWVNIKLPSGFYWSTIIILGASTAIWLALRAARVNNSSQVKMWLVVTLALGLAFTATQFQAWGQLIEKGNHVVSNIMQLKGAEGEDYSFSFKGEPMVAHDGDLFSYDDTYFEYPLKDRLLGSRNSASSYMYILTVLHILHLAGGLLYLLFVMRDAKRNKFNSENTLRLELCGTYWHFLDGLWIFLFLFLLFIH